MSIDAERARGSEERSPRLCCEEVGSDSPVLFLPHALGRFEDYRGTRGGQLAEQIAARGCCVLGADLPDIRTDGTHLEADPGRIDQLALAAETLLNERALFRAPVIGVGLGGLVALRMAARAPRRVPAVVADSPPGAGLAPAEPWDAHPTQRRTAEGAEPRLGDQKRWRQVFVETVKALRVPTLIVGGSDVPACEPATLYSVTRPLPEVHVALLPAEHAPACLDAPSFFLREVERFLAAYV